MKSSPAGEATKSASRTGDRRNISISKTSPAAGCDLIGSNKQLPNRTPRGSPAKSRTSWIRNSGQQGIRNKRRHTEFDHSLPGGATAVGAGEKTRPRNVGDT